MRTILLVGLILTLAFVAGCVEVKPLDASVSVDGNPQTFHTDFEKGNNSINITIHQKPSRLIWVQPTKIENFTLRCFDKDGKDALKLTLLSEYDLWYNLDSDEIKIDENTVLKFPQIMGGSHFDLYELNYTDNYFCEVNSNFKLRYYEYIDGVMTENRTTTCNDFWYEFRYYRLHCESIYTSNTKYSCGFINLDSEQNRFLSMPGQVIEDNCKGSILNELGAR